MADDTLTRYHYDEFVPEKFSPWLRFHESPPLGQVGPDFPLWTLDRQETSLRELVRQHALTIIEFGSFT